MKILSISSVALVGGLMIGLFVSWTSFGGQQLSAKQLTAYVGSWSTKDCDGQRSVFCEGPASCTDSYTDCRSGTRGWCKPRPLPPGTWACWYSCHVVDFDCTVTHCDKGCEYPI